jgi:hypothetical protein
VHVLYIVMVLVAIVVDLGPLVKLLSSIEMTPS